MEKKKQPTIFGFDIDSPPCELNIMVLLHQNQGRYFGLQIISEAPTHTSMA